jgi:hypothetical protein
MKTTNYKLQTTNYKLQTTNYKRIIIAGLALASLATSHAAVLISTTLNGGNLEAAGTNWTSASLIEFNNVLVPPTSGTFWLDSLSNVATQTINNTAAFNIATNSNVNVTIDFSRWNNAVSATATSVITQFFLGSNLLGTITNASDTNGLNTLQTFTSSSVLVTPGAYTFSIVTTGGAGTSLGFALDNLTVQANAIPEASTILLSGLSLVGLIARRNRK